MEKTARKPSTDPVQEKLRQNKANWNKDVSMFINDLIHLKKTMNGWPSKFFQEKSNIKEPIPADPVTIIGSLAGDFQELAQRGNSIVQEQMDYSQKRRKRQMKQLNLPLGQPQPKAPAEPEAPQPDLSQQLSLPHMASIEYDLIKVAAAFETKYSLVSEGSNPVSRFFARLLNPGIGFSEAARVRRVRMQLLNACARTWKKLDNFQAQVVKSSNNSIEKSNTMMHDIWREWETVRTGFATYKAMMPAKVEDPGGEIAEPEEVAKLKEKEEADKVESKMERIDRAREEGKPEPDDAGFDPLEEADRQSPDWAGSKEKLVDDLHEQQTLKLAKWAWSDLHFALRNLPILHENGIGVEYFETLTEYVKRFSIRTKWAAMVVDSHKETLDGLNDYFGTRERSFKDIINLLKDRKKRQEQLAKEQEKLEKYQEKEQAKQQRVDERKQKEEEKKQKANEKAEQAKQDELAKARQRALLAVPSNDQQPALETVAQNFLKKWIGKTRHQMSIFDQTSSQRLQIFEVSEEMRKTVDQIMDHLEKDIQVDVMGPLVDKANRQMTTIRSLTRNLHSLRTPKKGKK